ncbi:DUF5333 family protein [Jannaschia aquimarina]|uniref:Lysozyme inhibitor LprI N-terminal domain-containing protein n=1 Tax=Jannaschia aquimarina TaxID=935700 RepID=A0A0D1EJ59_9RHOB|nr:DUF5333 family protein [Jannaschia aquimarina]KIT15810.1 hypothetical protein jaqu_23900 [Jannaschia aquimarina]SNT09138.1 hypothetical protein SAMN05421775_105205 [Jannaschia aquimarina]
MRFLLLLSVLAFPASAEGVPDWYLDAVFAASTASRVAQACPTLDIDADAAARATREMTARLDGEGHSAEQVSVRLAGDASGLRSRQSAFLKRHALAEDPSAEAMCAAGRLEMRLRTRVGALLREVE